MPSPWYVHPFEAHMRGATGELKYYSRHMDDSSRAELFANVLWQGHTFCIQDIRSYRRT
jgi:hypothetical protein